MCIRDSIRADALGPGGEFDATRITVCKLVVFYSRYDTVLPVWFPAAEFFDVGLSRHGTTAIGTSGPAAPGDSLSMHRSPSPSRLPSGCHHSHRCFRGGSTALGTELVGEQNCVAVYPRIRAA
eukprot:TRINITY_DN23891_c0_g1_i4.p1 TRINITY_DN23891_c0_g1~~TRINITY_DN23891_c0_g1_i4.p1  ORF type:complete len:123 (+),score=19.95 TRINITY_DN23891_c0_g1_i4:142-510(+)